MKAGLAEEEGELTRLLGWRGGISDIVFVRKAEKREKSIVRDIEAKMNGRIKE